MEVIPKEGGYASKEMETYGQPMFKGSRTTLLVDKNCDPLRCYVDIPGVAGWREHLDPIEKESRHWSHVGMQLTTWSLREVIRYGALEEFLLLGEWGIFMHVPEEIPMYEDVNWKSPYFEKMDCQGEPAGHLGRGEIVASPGLHKGAIAEILVADEDCVVKRFFTPYRFPNEQGKRLLQKLPAREHNEDAMAMFNLTSGEFSVLGMPWLIGESGEYLEVTALRDPRSTSVGRLKKGLVVSLSQIVGTRAQIWRVSEGGAKLLGGWVALMTLDGSTTLERILYETDAMKEQAEHAAHLAHITAIIEAGGDEAIEFPWAEKPKPPPWIEPVIIPTMKKEALFIYQWAQHLQKPLDEELEEARIRKGLVAEEWNRRLVVLNTNHREKRAHEVDFSLLEHEFPMEVGLKDPIWKKSKRPAGNYEQRDKMTGGWRQMLDPVWKKLMYYEPISGRCTWGIMEVLGSGGLEDLLLNRTWHIACVDPLAVEVMKDDEWTMSVYGEKGCTGQPVLRLAKGTFVIVKNFDTRLFLAAILLPPNAPGESCWTGYCKYRNNDGRPVLRSMLPFPEDMVTVAEDGDPILAEEPEYDCLEGPYEVTPLEELDHIDVTEGQDMVSQFMHHMPRGYRICDTNPEDGFEQVLGMRAELPEEEGGGWASLFTADARPLFKKEPSQPPTEKGVRRYSKTKMSMHLPVRWPEIGVPGMPKLGDPGMPKPLEEPHYETALPLILEQMGGGRALCDWNRLTLEGKIDVSADWSCYRNAFTQLKSSLDELLSLKVWKAVIVELDMPIREQIPPHSNHVCYWPKGAMLIAEWVNPCSAVRVLVPGQRDDPRPRHLWADLGGNEGSFVVPLVPGREFWIEPKGGHLPYEVQREEEPNDPWEVVVRAERDRSSERIVGLRRADAVQIAELDGRMARIVITFRLGILEFPHGGWIDLFDESGWCQLMQREEGVMHPLQEQAEGLGEFPPTASIVGRAKADDIVVVPQETELPALLWQIGELEQASMLARDWHEQTDPVWGRLYYVNRWSGQVIHSLGAGGVYSVAVRLTLWLSNITLDNLKVTDIEVKKQAQMRAGPADIQPGDAEAAWKQKLARIEQDLRGPICALADVPLDMMRCEIVEAPNDIPPAGADDEEDEMTRWQRWSDTEKLPHFRIVATITAPGAHAAWAASGLREDMADGERFNTLALGVIGQVPDLQSCKIVPRDTIQLAQATLDEVDVPPWVRPPTPPPPENPPPPVDEEFVQFRKNLRYAKPKILDLKSCKALNLAASGFALGDMRALAEGLDLAAQSYDPFIEEVHFWEVSLNDFQMQCFKQAFDRGRMAALTTLLLDGNKIGALGAQALGDGLTQCPKLRELSVAQNPIGIGLVHLCKKICEGLVILNASQADITDVGAVACGQALPGWPKMNALRLIGNAGITLRAAEVVARGVLGNANLKLADLTGSAAKPHEARVARIFEDADNNPSRMRV